MEIIIAEGYGEFEVRVRNGNRDCDDLTVRTFDNEEAALGFAAQLSSITGIVCRTFETSFDNN